MLARSWQNSTSAFSTRDILGPFSCSHRYATEVDIDFVRKAVRSIGRLAIKVSSAADDCIKVLVELIENKVTYVVQEAIVVIKDIFRRFPDKYEKIIPILCENLGLLDEPEAKAAIIWIVGQYAERIENAEELMENLTYSFLEESTEVRSTFIGPQLTDGLPTGSTSSRDGLSQVLYSTAQPRPEARAEGAQVGNRRHRQPRLAGPRVHVLAPSCDECGCCERHRHGRATAR